MYLQLTHVYMSCLCKCVYYQTNTYYSTNTQPEKNMNPEDLFVDSEYMSTQVVVVSKSNEQEFLSMYENLAPEAVGYGPAENRMETVGSPVVPGTASRITEDSEGYVMYSLVILKNYQDLFKVDAQAHRVMVRKFDLRTVLEMSGLGAQDDEDGKGRGVTDRLAVLEVDFEQSRNQLVRWCKSHFGEVFIAWMHVKVGCFFVFGCSLPFDCFSFPPA